MILGESKLDKSRKMYTKTRNCLKSQNDEVEEEVERRKRERERSDERERLVPQMDVVVVVGER